MRGAWSATVGAVRARVNLRGNGMAPTRARRRAARLALAATLSTVVTAGWGASAHADGLVRIVPPGGAGPSRTIDLAQLKPDVPDATYTSVASPGGSPQPVTVTDGYSLPALLAATAPKGGWSFGSAEIVAPSGPPVVLDSTQVTSKFAYSTGGPPVVWNGASGIQFLVPSTPTGTTNAGETFPGVGGIVTIQLYSEPPLSVGISPTPEPAVVNKPVQLNSYVYGGSASQYQWNLGDGSTSSEADPTHVYTHTGTYEVYLVANGADAPGASSILRLVVGKPKPGTPGAGPATAVGGTGLGGTGTGQGGGSGGGSGSGHGGGAATASGTLAHIAGKRAPVHRVRKPPRPMGPLVSGVLLSDPAQVAASERAAAGAAQAARYARKQAALAEWVWILIAVLVMLFGGALLEWDAPRALFGLASTP